MPDRPLTEDEIRARIRAWRAQYEVDIASGKRSPPRVLTYDKKGPPIRWAPPLPEDQK